MNLPARKQEEQPEPPKAKVDDELELLDDSDLFPHKPLPTREVEFLGSDGKRGKVMVQALTMRELDEINHIQNQPIRDARGKVIEEANQIGWDAKVVARALRRPNKQRVVTEHWKAKAEEIESQWLPGTIRKVRAAVLELSGFGTESRSEEKKDS